MSHRIAQLMNQPEQQITKLLTKLEDKNGFPSNDARFLAESIQKIRTKITELGLDPDDTKGEELYHALLVKYQQDSKLFDAEHGAITLDFDQKSAKAAQLIATELDAPRRWALKYSAAKRIWRQHPAKHVMKLLHYRSVESILKHENICELFLAAQLLESPTWLKAQGRLVSHLDQTAFELREVQLAALSSQKWADLNPLDSYTVTDDSIGAIGLLPSDDAERAPLLSLVLIFLEALSAYSHFQLGPAMAKLSRSVEWWADMDHLVADLGSEHTSLSAKDCALNSMHGKPYAERLLDHGQTSFWKELLGRYENQLDSDGTFDESVRQKVANLKFEAPEPAYDFVEDFDG